MTKDVNNRGPIGGLFGLRNALAVLVAVWLPGPALAAHIEWSQGGTNLNLTGAQRCTLRVAFTPDERSRLREWRLHWVSDSGNGAPLRVIESGGPADVVEACDVRPDREGGLGARADTAYFCTNGSDASEISSVRYVLDVSGSPMRIAVVPVLETDGMLRVDPVGIAEATVNGGTNASYAPIVVDVGYANTADATLYRVFGAYLDGIQDARIWQSAPGATIPIQIVRRASDFAELRGPLLERVRSGFLRVRNGSGQWTPIPIEWSAAGLSRAEAPRLLIRVERTALDGHTRSAPVHGAASTGLLPGLADALAKAGVDLLRQLFPADSSRAGSSMTTNVIGEPIQLEPLDDWFVAALGLDADVASVLDRVRATPGVREASEERWLPLAHLTPNDPRFGQQWGLVNPGSPVCGYPAIGTAQITADAAWNQTTGSPNVRLAILDSGINPDHEDLGPGRVRLGPDFVNEGSPAYDFNGHGTAVAGIAAAVGNNNTGVAGVAWQVQPWAVRVLDSFAGGVSADLGQGIVWATDLGMPILNMSVGWNDPSPELGSGGHNLLAGATLNALKRGLFVVASSGNAREPFGPFIACPAHLHRRVYTVGSYLPNGARWQDQDELAISDCSFDPCFESNFGGFLDAMAPGGRLIATTALGPTDYHHLSGCVQFNRSTMGYSGTSASAPVVSGIAALLLARRPELIGEDIAQMWDPLESTCRHASLSIL